MKWILIAALFTSCDWIEWTKRKADTQIPDIKKTLLVEIKEENVTSALAKGNRFVYKTVTVPVINLSEWTIGGLFEGIQSLSSVEMFSTERRVLRVPIFRLGKFSLTEEDTSNDSLGLCWAYDVSLKTKEITNEREAPFDWCVDSVKEHAPSFTLSWVKVRNWLYGLF